LTLSPRPGIACAVVRIGRHTLASAKTKATSGLPGVSEGLSARVSRAYPPGAIVQGIPLARRQALRYLVHDLDDLPHDITAVATGGIFEQIAGRRADYRLSVVSVRKIPIEVV
jgi:hypothetical protein